MNEEKLLEKIEEIVDKRAVQTETKVENRIESMEIKMEHRFIAVDKHFDSIDKQLKELKKQQDHDRKDWTEFFHEVGLFIEEIKQKLLKRIERIEDHLSISKN